MGKKRKSSKYHRNHMGSSIDDFLKEPWQLEEAIRSKTTRDDRAGLRKRTMFRRMQRYYTKPRAILAP